MPDWALPFSLGVALATLFYDVVFRDHSRIREIWHYLTDVFVVERAKCSKWNGMPDSDVGIRVIIRFRRRLRGATLMLRIFSNVGSPHQSFHELIKIETLDVEAGETRVVPIATVGTPMPTWDHTIPRGWGPTSPNMPALLGLSKNIAVLEVRHGLLVQRFKLFIEYLPRYEAGGHVPLASLYLQDENDDVFDPSDDNRMGDWKYA